MAVLDACMASIAKGGSETAISIPTATAPPPPPPPPPMPVPHVTAPAASNFLKDRAAQVAAGGGGEDGAAGGGRTGSADETVKVGVRARGSGVPPTGGQGKVAGGEL
jgi:hypothetical protein